LDYVKNLKLNDKDYYQELKMADTIQAIYKFSIYDTSSNLEWISWVSISKMMHLSEISQKTIDKFCVEYSHFSNLKFSVYIPIHHVGSAIFN